MGKPGVGGKAEGEAVPECAVAIVEPEAARRERFEGMWRAAQAGMELEGV